MDTDVIIIGAGLAGLQAARRLQRAGRSVRVLEREDAVGGRIRTDRVDDFRCDRGFQVLNPAYPAVRSWIDMPALRLQPFGVGAVLTGACRPATLAHPLRHPRHAVGTLLDHRVGVRELLGLARFLGPTLLRPRTASRGTQDQTLADALDSAGLTGRLRHDMIDTFLAGVLADSSGTASANYVRLLLRSFALGAPGVPRDGMHALPRQMAQSLIEPVRTEITVAEVSESGRGVTVRTDCGTLRARCALLAVGPQDISHLAGAPTPPTHGLTTWWFRAPEPPLRGRFLVLDTSRDGTGPRGPVWNTAVMSEVAPSYAPIGQHLVQATTLLGRPDGLAGEAEVRAHLESIYATSTRRWEVLAHHVVPHTLPAQPPPLIDRRPQRITDGVFVAGDHRDTGSIQGALVSGDRAGEAIDALLGRSPRSADAVGHR